MGLFLWLVRRIKEKAREGEGQREELLVVLA
jgi:hypothetical protein